MASVIASARRSTSSVFDLFGTTAETAVQLIRTASRSVSMLDAKAELMHDRVITNCRLQRINMTSEEIINAANTHVDMIEDAHRRNFPSLTFDRTAAYQTAIAKMEAALAEPQ